ncbi:hypothetical protein B296_00012330 [Ensete ventricosum]|uniref:Uncharacterized protein n=1 Tax=Ensete ventricosum TaxID=4639 RepID=A0A426ZQ23_ENSVE|nr:hypothetical protein B296_00012330 [Ensete ventricosum]
MDEREEAKQRYLTVKAQEDRVDNALSKEVKRRGGLLRLLVLVIALPSHRVITYVQGSPSPVSLGWDGRRLRFGFRLRGASTTTSCKEPVRCSTKWLREEVLLISGCTCMQCRSRSGNSTYSVASPTKIPCSNLSRMGREKRLQLRAARNRLGAR